MKIEQAFHVAIHHDGRPPILLTIYGETFFLARTALAEGVEPGDVRIERPRRYEP